MRHCIIILPQRVNCHFCFRQKRQQHTIIKRDTEGNASAKTNISSVGLFSSGTAIVDTFSLSLFDLDRPISISLARLARTERTHINVRRHRTTTGGDRQSGRREFDGTGLSVGFNNDVRAYSSIENGKGKVSGYRLLHHVRS